MLLMHNSVYSSVIHLHYVFFLAINATNFREKISRDATSTKAPSQTSQPPPTVLGGTPVLHNWIKSYIKHTSATAKVHKTPLC